MSGRHARVDSSAGRQWRGKLVTMLAAWMAAFLIVTVLLSFFEDQLGSLPLALRALVMSGVLMTTMTTVVIGAERRRRALAGWPSAALSFRRD